MLIKRISKKILYFLTIKEASDQVSLYWHQAFLMNYMLLRGNLTDAESAKAARQAMWQVIETTYRSSLLQLAQQIVGGTGPILRSLLKFRQGHEDELVQNTKKEQMFGWWADFQAYFEALAALYDQTCQAKLKALQQPPMLIDS